MNSPIQLNAIIPSLLITLALSCLGLLPKAQAVVPAPDGGYPGGNTAEGQNALLSRTTGGFNTAVGWFSLESLTTGSFNTGVGAGTLVLNTGDENTATGVGALLLNTIGGQNTANGASALFNNTEGLHNAATGWRALFSNTTGNQNTATGSQALDQNTTGFSNTANGGGALETNTDGVRNTAIGFFALGLNTSSYNIALGFHAGRQLTTGDNNIDIGNVGVAAEADTIRIGASQTATYIAGIFGATVPNGVTVIVDPTGHLGTIASSKRFKDEIRPMDKASEAILALKPVTFCYKKELDPNGIPQFGLVAEDVAKVNPDLVARDAKGELYTVRYEAVNAMLLNEFLKEHRKVEEQERELRQQKALIGCLNSTVEKQEATTAQQQKEIQALTASLKEQASQIQKVSAQIEVNRPAPRMVVAERP
jgi:Chaperone of endosialidase